MTKHSRFYHRTRTDEAAHEILRGGFRDVTSYMNGADITGVWLSDMPLDASTIVELQGLLLSVMLPEDAVKDYEVVIEFEEGGGNPNFDFPTYREWVVPAEIVNKGEIRLFDEFEEEEYGG